MTQIRKAAYAGWPNCYRISNGHVELIVTTDVGPRVIRYGLVGGQNLFKEFPDQLGRSGEKHWQARGGHRLWAAPERVPYTYALDNSTVTASVRGQAITLTSAIERETGLVKQMSVKLAARGTQVDVTHRIRNTRQKSQSLAVWALTMLAQGGHGIAAFPQRGAHPKMLTPTHPLVMWAYSDLSDPRWHFTPKYMVLQQDPSVSAPQKLGQFHDRPGGAYLLGEEMFVKSAHASAAKTYADFGCSFEMFANNDFLELETLGPLVDLAPGAVTAHREIWTLRHGVKIGAWSDAELDRVFAR